MPDLITPPEVVAIMKATGTSQTKLAPAIAAEVNRRAVALGAGAAAGGGVAAAILSGSNLIAAAIREGGTVNAEPTGTASKLPALPAPVENQWTPGTFNKLNWGPENLHALPWRAGNVTQAADRAVHIVGDANGEAGIKSGSEWNGGSIEYEVTFPSVIPSGVDAAAGYLYANSNADEIDFPEVLQDGRPRFAIHTDGRQVVKVLETDVRGKRHTFGVAWKAGEVVTFTMDGREVWTVKASALPAEIGRLPSAPMAFVSNVAFLPGLPGWVGPFTMPKADEEVRMILHGWRFTQF